MAQLTHTARFGATEALERMLDDIACPACGYLDPADTYRLTAGNKVRFFCDGCGAFVTIVLNDGQAEAVRRWSSIGSTVGAASQLPGEERN